MRPFPHHLVWPALIFAGLAFARFGPEPSVVCPAQAAFDVPCPTCGGTRAVRALVRGDIRQALWFNPGVTAGALTGLAYAICAPLLVLSGRPPPLLEPRGGAVRVLRWLLPAGLLLNWLFLLWAGRFDLTPGSTYQSGVGRPDDPRPPRSLRQGARRPARALRSAQRDL